MLGIRLTRTFILMGVIMAVFAITAVACASEPEEPAQPALSEEQLRSIVSDAVAQAQPAPQQQVSGDEISSMVAAAMGAMTSSQVSASEIQSMVENAVAGAAAEGATPEQIQSMVEVRLWPPLPTRLQATTFNRQFLWRLETPKRA